MLQLNSKLEQKLILIDVQFLSKIINTSQDLQKSSDDYVRA
jgi:hypothetical protein